MSIMKDALLSGDKDLCRRASEDKLISLELTYAEIVSIRSGLKVLRDICGGIPEDSIDFFNGQSIIARVAIVRQCELLAQVIDAEIAVAEKKLTGATEQ